MKPINPQNVFFIKLGSGGHLEQACIEKDNTIRIGFIKTDHNACLAGNWDKIRDDELNNGRTKSKATEITNEIRRFYEEGDNALWITFYANRMWWCFAEKEIDVLPDGSKSRKVIGQWRDTNVSGHPLSFETISGRLLQVRGFRGTNCSVDKTYVINKINDITPPEVARSIDCVVALQESIIPLIQNLTWQDFELLVDLVFSNAGWKRISVLGKQEKNIDIDLRSPITGERVMVQIKAVSDRKEFEFYYQEFSKMKDFTTFFYVVHSPKKSLKYADTPPRAQLIFAEQLAKLIIDGGLVRWLIEKNR